MKNKIIIITDSMGMPRKELDYEKTWIYMLKKSYKDYDFIDKTARGSTSARLVTEGGNGVDMLETYKPNIVILQLGLTECAPRLFKKPSLEFFIVSRILPEKIRNKYIKFLKKHRGRNPNITDIPPEIFKSNITNYFERAKNIGTRIIVLLISKPSELLLLKSPHIKKNIIRYNNIYKEVASQYPNVEVVEPIDGDINSYVVDELHINTQGAKIIYNKLKIML